MTIEIPSINQLDEGARTFLDATSGKGIFAFYGDMGAGKTTFIKAVCEQMGIKDMINSPTFAIINEYSLPDGDPVYHFDFYRLKKAEEALNLGCEDYFASGHTCFIEWPEKIGNLLPEDSVRVDITVLSDGTRTVTY
jgi:tRNA threonylcarbamoyladenosine biosynthesis protein TsaE